MRYIAHCSAGFCAALFASSLLFAEEPEIVITSRTGPAMNANVPVGLVVLEVSALRTSGDPYTEIPSASGVYSWVKGDDIHTVISNEKGISLLLGPGDVAAHIEWTQNGRFLPI